MLIELKSITRTYRLGDKTINALDGVDWSMKRSEYVAIMGSSGSGKSTFMNVLGCLDTPTRGSYLFGNCQLSGLSREQLARFRNRHIGFVFQQFHLVSYLSALENVMLQLRYGGVDSKESLARAERVLVDVGLKDRLNSRPSQLSGGQQQRVAIARAIVHEPTLVLADEPTGALDSVTSGEILDLFDSLSEKGVSIIVVTHDPQVARRADRITKLKDGKIVMDSPWSMLPGAETATAGFKLQAAGQIELILWNEQSEPGPENRLPCLFPRRQ